MQLEQYHERLLFKQQYGVEPVFGQGMERVILASDYGGD